MQEKLDWRLPVFEAGRCVAAFDGLPAALPTCAGHGRQAAQAGVALLLMELWRRDPIRRMGLREAKRWKA